MLDLGSAPGGWLQAACTLVGNWKDQPHARVVGVDQRSFPIPKAHVDKRVQVLHMNAKQVDRAILQQAMHSWELKEDKGQAWIPMHVVLSDMAPPTTGMRDVDAQNAMELAHLAVSIAVGNLKDSHGLLGLGGNMVVKTFDGQDAEALRKEVKPHFQRALWVRPETTRPGSREKYLVALHRCMPHLC